MVIISRYFVNWAPAMPYRLPGHTGLPLASFIPTPHQPLRHSWGRIRPRRLARIDTDQRSAQNHPPAPACAGESGPKNPRLPDGRAPAYSHTPLRLSGSTRPQTPGCSLPLSTPPPHAPPSPQTTPVPTPALPGRPGLLCQFIPPLLHRRDVCLHASFQVVQPVVWVASNPGKPGVGVVGTGRQTPCACHKQPHQRLR
jgi:hypothetical protein